MSKNYKVIIMAGGDKCEEHYHFPTIADAKRKGMECLEEYRDYWDARAEIMPEWMDVKYPEEDFRTICWCSEDEMYNEKWMHVSEHGTRMYEYFK